MVVHIVISFLASFSLLSFLFYIIGIPKAEWDAKKYLEKVKKMGPTKQELHELPDTEIEKSGTIRCASV